MRTGKQVKEVCEKLGGFEKFYDITAGGLATETYSAMKIAWYNDNMPELVEKTWKFLQAKEYVAFRLTGEVATDYTDASDSAMMDRRTRDWSPEILEAIGITADKLPKIYPSSHVMGHVTAQAAKLTGLVEGTLYVYLLTFPSARPVRASWKRGSATCTSARPCGRAFTAPTPWQTAPRAFWAFRTFPARAMCRTTSCLAAACATSG